MKERIFSIATYIVSFMALLQLALSQVHITVITKVFALQIGFFFFGFIIFGIVALLNANNAKSKNNGVLMIACTIIVIASGIKYIQYLLADVQAGNLLTYSDISFVMYFTISALVVYGVGAVVMLVSKPTAKKRSI